jgi:hypothetical protein
MKSAAAILTAIQQGRAPKGRRDAFNLYNLRNISAGSYILALRS